MNKKFINRRIE